MSNDRYKIVISGKRIYREHTLSKDMDSTLIKIGTTKNCQIRFNKDYFFDEFELNIIKTPSGWQLSCDENVYFTLDGVMKIYSKDLSHGDEIIVKYLDYNSEIFKINFFIDFDSVERKYDKIVDISDIQSITIGGSDKYDIYINDPLLEKDNISISNKNGAYYIINNNTKYGVYLNGQKISESSIKLNDYDFFNIVGYSFYFKDKHLFTSKLDNVVIKNLKSSDVSEQQSAFEYPKFNRNTRIKYLIPNDEIEVLPPKTMGNPPKKNIVLSLVPAIAMLALTIVLRGILGSGGSFVIYSAATMSIGIIMSVVTFLMDSRQYKKDLVERKSVYLEYIKRKEEEIVGYRNKEWSILQKIYRPMEENIQIVNSFSKELFERDVKDEDFLFVRLGTGSAEANCKVKYNKQEFKDTKDELVSIPEQVEAKYHYISDAPIISKLSQSNAIGVVGSQSELYSMLKNLTLDISIRHFYKDVKLFYMFDEKECDRFTWLRWLKHVENDELGVRNLMFDEESKNTILEYLYSKLSTREAEVNQKTDLTFNSHYVVFIFDSKGISKHPISKYFETCNKYGFTFIFFEGNEELLPKGCNEIVRLDSNNYSGSLILSDNGDVLNKFDYPEIEDKDAEAAVLKLSPIYIDEVNLESEMTKNISLFELLEIMSIDDLDLSARWSNSKVYKSMAAPLGVKTKNEVVYLDLNEKNHGPHGLVAGTTGSGKSEILQSYILSMATLFHPYEVGFVIIDFKGGGMVNQFRDLPHLIGSITNIDGREINRSLLSIKAELRRRQEIFSEYDVNHIDSYIKLYKDGRTKYPLPHLIIIVDEFAELKSEYPDFMKELISAARIGRSLGVHLILATQKPSGVVDNQIWSNSRFKLCLKVQTREDSNEVIKTPLAAEIVEPGRAYLQVGNNEIFELFQSAYSGAKIDDSDGENSKVFDIYQLNLWGKKQLVYTNRKVKEDKNSKNQLQAVVEYINGYCKNNNITQLAGICLPSLAEVIKTDALNYEVSNDIGISVPIGMFDDPEQQSQGEVVIEPFKDNIYIVGSSQTGKTVMLQTITYGLIKKYNPSQVNIYLIDCGSMVLKIFENSAHVGGVVLSNEEEKCKNLFKLLNTIVIERRNILSSKGVGNYSAYLDAGYKDMSMVIVIIDNMAAFKEYFPNQAEELNSLSREALGVGISFIITSATSNALNYRTQANFGKKLVLNCNDTNEYSNAFGHCRQTPKENAGRGLMLHDKRILEYQAAIFGQSNKEAERSQELKQFIEMRNTNCSCNARIIPMVPEKLILHQALTANSNAFREKGMLPIGMDFATVDYSGLNLNTCGSLALLGDAESKEHFVSNLLRMLNQTIIFHNVEAVVIDDKAKTFKESSTFGFVRSYTNDVSEGLSLVNDYCEDISRRRDEMEDIEQDDISYLLLLLNNTEVFKRICNDKNESKSFAELVKGASAAGAFVLITTVENQPVGFNSSEVLKAIKDERKAILFAPLSESKLFEISGRNRMETAFDKSIGYRFEGGNYTKIKIFE